MDKERFELTRDELEEIYAKVNLGYPAIPNSRDRLVAKSQVAKVLSQFEPVELEALGEAEIDKAIFEQRRVLELNGHKPTTADSKRAVTFATIHKNKAKGQLYRMKGE